jgi:septal ring factor EnvC (AmiA/AmiB activator)
MNRQRIATSVALAALLVMSAAPAAAQSSEQRIRQQREELERIRRERAELENRRSRLQNSVHDLREEVVILDRQADATARAMRSLDAQLASIATSVD